LSALVLAPAARAKPHHHHHHHGHKPKTTVRGIVQHQKALQGIADMNGGTRYTKTPGYTASVAYVRERMKRAGLKVKTVEFNMPEWRETAPPVLQQLTPTNKTYTPGTAADDNNPAVRLHHVRVLADEGGPERARRAGERHRDPEPGRRHEQRGLRGR
jgi:hypothetical protein